ncbi:MAG: hypothetical protein HC852_19845 [Acaryochloridaceae cyanobacterium RU_4_10]|nr:hypothetical protein [Acaryochloridaceae cyanobacterium RU_4_10]
MGHFSLTSGQASWTHNLLISPRFLEALLHKAQGDLRQYKDSAIQQMEAIARHPHTPESALRQLLLETEEHSIRLAIAANPQTPQYLYEIWGLKILESTSSYQFQSFLEQVARNIYTPEGLLLELANHANRSIRIAAATNPCVSEKFWPAWENQTHYAVGDLEQCWRTEENLLEQWQRKLTAADRLNWLRNPEAMAPVLAKLARSSSWVERCAIAQHPNTPEPIRQTLAQDANRIVRAAAKANLL